MDIDPQYYDGEELTVKTLNNLPQNIYVQSATFNSELLGKYWVGRNTLAAGGELILEMGPEPVVDETCQNLPPSMGSYRE